MYIHVFMSYIYIYIKASIIYLDIFHIPRLPSWGCILQEMDLDVWGSQNDWKLKVRQLGHLDICQLCASNFIHFGPGGENDKNVSTKPPPQKNELIQGAAITKKGCKFCTFNDSNSKNEDPRLEQI